MTRSSSAPTNDDVGFFAPDTCFAVDFFVSGCRIFCALHGVGLFAADAHGKSDNFTRHVG